MLITLKIPEIKFKWSTLYQKYLLYTPVFATPFWETSYIIYAAVHDDVLKWITIIADL